MRGVKRLFGEKASSAAQHLVKGHVHVIPPCAHPVDELPQNEGARRVRSAQVHDDGQGALEVGFFTLGIVHKDVDGGECVEACAAIEIASVCGATSAERYAVVASIASELYAMLRGLVR